MCACFDERNTISNNVHVYSYIREVKSLQHLSSLFSFKSVLDFKKHQSIKELLWEALHCECICLIKKSHNMLFFIFIYPLDILKEHYFKAPWMNFSKSNSWVHIKESDLL